MDPGSAVAAAAAAATAGALARAAQKQAAAAKAAEDEPMVELDLEAGRVKPRGDDAAAADQAAAPAAPAPAAPAAPAPPPGSTARFFVRGASTLGEHHLKDHFEKFGQVLEASHVRDKKTQRPRGIAFVTLAPRPPKDGEEPMTLDALVERVMSASHKVKDAELDLQEAMAKPEKEEAEGEQSPTAGGASPTAASATAAAAQEPEQAPMDPAAQANAQAQWQMHYLALAINASVPEVPTTPSKPQPSGAVPKAAGFQAAPRNGGGKGRGKGSTPY